MLADPHAVVEVDVPHHLWHEPWCGRDEEPAGWRHCLQNDDDDDLPTVRRHTIDRLDAAADDEFG